MKIVIDLTSLCRKMTGIEHYAHSLSLTLLSLTSPHEFYLLFRKVIPKEFIPLASKKIHLISSPFSSQLLTEQIYIPWFLSTHTHDFSFFPCFPPGLLVRNKMLFFVHDAVMWRHPNYLSWKNKLYFKPLANRAITKAVALFTNSDFSKSDISNFFPSAVEKIVTIKAALPINNTLHTNDAVNHTEILSKFHITKPYLLTVGSLEPRKNIPFIIHSLADLLREQKLLLVLVGRYAWGQDEIAQIIKIKKLESWVIRTGYVASHELSVLYQNALLFLFLSLYEGFGFPLLEAFKNNCPVITSPVSSLPEVSGDAAVYVDPYNSSQLKEQVLAIINSPNVRTDLIRKGADRYALFSWERTAHLFLTHLENRMNTYAK